MGQVDSHGTKGRQSKATPAAPVSSIRVGAPVTAQDCVGDLDILTAWRTGRLAPLGIPAPPLRQARSMPWS